MKASKNNVPSKAQFDLPCHLRTPLTIRSSFRFFFFDVAEESAPFILKIIKNMALAQTTREYNAVHHSYVVVTSICRARPEGGKFGRLDVICENNGFSNVLKYFEDEWEPYVGNWCQAYRRVAIGDRTNNIAESHFKVQYLQWLSSCVSCSFLFFFFSE